MWQPPAPLVRPVTALPAGRRRGCGVYRQNYFSHCHPGILHLFGCIIPQLFQVSQRQGKVFHVQPPWGRGRWQGWSSLHGQKKSGSLHWDEWWWCEDPRESNLTELEHSDGCHLCLVCEMCSNALWGILLILLQNWIQQSWDAGPHLIPKGAHPSGQACWTRWLLQNLQRVVK